jgi:hypothetical protein
MMEVIKKKFQYLVHQFMFYFSSIVSNWNWFDFNQIWIQFACSVTFSQTEFYLKKKIIHHFIVIGSV